PRAPRSAAGRRAAPGGAPEGGRAALGDRGRADRRGIRRRARGTAGQPAPPTPVRGRGGRVRDVLVPAGRLAGGLDARARGGAIPDEVLKLVTLAERVVVAGELDACRVRLAAGRARPEVAILAPPLAWAASDGRLGHELPLDARVMLNPGRVALRDQRERAL